MERSHYNTVRQQSARGRCQDLMQEKRAKHLHDLNHQENRKKLRHYIARHISHHNNAEASVHLVLQMAVAMQVFKKV
jgi:hypothetical protein